MYQHLSLKMRVQCRLTSSLYIFIFIIIHQLESTSAVIPSVPSSGRSAHWVLRSSDLRNSVDFFRKVFQMRILRHEESPESCPVTCNGKSKTPWSKTMMGYQTEATKRLFVRFFSFAFFLLLFFFCFFLSHILPFY